MQHIIRAQRIRCSYNEHRCVRISSEHNSRSIHNIGAHNSPYFIRCFVMPIQVRFFFSISKNYNENVSPVFYVCVYVCMCVCDVLSPIRSLSLSLCVCMCTHACLCVSIFHNYFMIIVGLRSVRIPIQRNYCACLMRYNWRFVNS